MKCLESNTVLEFIEGSLAKDRLAGVDLHLAECARCRQLVAALARSEDDPSKALSAGDVIDHYQIVELLGSGGMGEVYLARDNELSRKVALKIIRPAALDLGSQGAVERFLYEARATAQFNHPHIVTVHSVGEHAGRPYVVLEYVAGQNLRQRLAQSALDPPEVLRIGCEIAEALQEAHRHRILHRDLKPENIMLTEEGKVRVVDFGLAKTLEHSGLSLEAISHLSTSLGSPIEAAGTRIKGTPAYLAPEQWQQREAAPATDIWQLGLVLYELAGNELPSKRSPPLQWVLRVCDAEPMPPLVDPSLPPDFVQLVTDCLQKDPESRPTASVVVRRLQSLIEYPIAAHAQRSRRWVVGIVAAVLLALVSGAAITTRILSAESSVETKPNTTVSPPAAIRADQGRLPEQAPKDEAAPSRSKKKARPKKAAAATSVGISVMLDGRLVPAAIYFDGRWRGQSPLFLRDVSVGWHVVKAVADGQEKVRRVLLKARRENSVTLRLQR